MRVALAQIASPDTESQGERISRVERTLRGLDAVDLIVLPELWSAGYFHFNEYESLAETVDGPTVRMCAAVAKDLQAYIHAGSIVEKGDNGKLYNTSILISPTGTVVHRYRKIHVFGYESLEASLLTPGTSLPVAATDFGRISGITCYDLRFPGLWTELSNRGVDIAIVPAAWPAARREHWRLLTSARAVEHQIFVIACNATGEQGGVELGGHSRIVDPTGIVLGECGDGEEILILDLEPEYVQQVRKKFPFIADRLPTYSELTE